MSDPTASPGRQTPSEVFRVFLRLGLTSFGGPIAHLAYFREAFVVRRRWLDEAAYADLLALCQFLPGPASSQVGIGIGLMKAGLSGALAAWLGFTLPSAVALTLFGYGILAFDAAASLGALHGLKLAAVAVVAQALWGMGRSLCPDAPRMTVAVLAAIPVLLAPSPWTQVAVIVAGGVVGLFALRVDPGAQDGDLHVPVSSAAAVAALATLATLLLALPVVASVWPSHAVALTDGFLRVGSLVFGGGHVVLPLLQAEVVPPGWVSNEAFLAGYGAAQAVPGPLFTFAAFLGTVMNVPPNGVLGAALCLVAVFVPSFLLVIGVLPFWGRLRRVQSLRRALAGVNAAVVGVLLAAFYDPVWTSGVRSAADLALALGALILLVVRRAPPWLVVALAALAGWLLALA